MSSALQAGDKQLMRGGWRSNRLLMHVAVEGG